MIDLNWDKAYETGHKVIDDEHKVFVDLIRSTSDAIDSHYDLERVNRYFEELGLYAMFHFRSEENLMIDSDYPEYESHRTEHKKLLTKFAEKTAEYKRDPNTGESLIMFLFEWFVTHTIGVDRQLAKHLATYEK